VPLTNSLSAEIPKVPREKGDPPQSNQISRTSPGLNRVSSVFNVHILSFPSSSVQQIASLQTSRRGKWIWSGTKGALILLGKCKLVYDLGRGQLGSVYQILFICFFSSVFFFLLFTNNLHIDKSNSQFSVLIQPDLFTAFEILQ
jgi:hypothetical protein